MSWIANLFGGQTRTRVGKYNADTIAAEVGIMNHAGGPMNVTETTGLAVAAVYACVYKIATTVASMKLQFVTVNGRNRVVDESNPLHVLVSREPNSDCHAFEFWEGITAHAVMYGNGFAYIERDQSGRPVSMYPLEVDDVEVKRTKDGTIFYQVRGHGMIDAENILHISNLFGLSPIRLHRQNIGLSMAAKQYGNDFFGNGGQMTGILASDQPLTATQMETMQMSWNESATTAGTKLLPFGFKYTPVSVPPEQIAFIETQKFQGEEIARIFNVPPAMIQLESQTTYNNVEQQTLMFRNNLLPWVNRIEMECRRKLIPSFERTNNMFEFNMSDLFRSDMDTRSKFYSEGIGHGWMTINEARKNEGLNPVENGDEPLVQVNQIQLSRMGEFSEKISAENVSA
jgi:HK97 family phage portal protein